MKDKLKEKIDVKKMANVDNIEDRCGNLWFWNFIES